MGFFADIWEDAGWLVEVLGGTVAVIAGGATFVDFATSPNVGAVVAGTAIGAAIMGTGGYLIYKGIVEEFYADYVAPTQADCAANKLNAKTAAGKIIYSMSCGMLRVITLGLGGNSCINTAQQYVACNNPTAKEGKHMTGWGTWANDDNASVIPYHDILMAFLGPILIFDGILIFFEGEGFNFLGTENFWMAIVGAQLVTMGSVVVFDIVNSIMNLVDISYETLLLVGGISSSSVGAIAGMYKIAQGNAGFFPYIATLGFAVLDYYLIKEFKNPTPLGPADQTFWIVGKDGKKDEYTVTSDDKETCEGKGGIYFSGPGMASRCEISSNNTPETTTGTETPLQNTTGSGLNTGKHHGKRMVY